MLVGELYPFVSIEGDGVDVVAQLSCQGQEKSLALAELRTSVGHDLDVLSNST